ncbi:MAG: site-2 protease family protein [Patescibacteria group bacterium]|nr:site-2 protease family protein [Patescibacteria group bacterium]MCL5432211.1 site-2 protease family protein [Patescibacteria group bacterium]
MFLLQLAILIYSVILHEISHGWVADHLGDPTARLAKRLTLNPIPHIDPLMTVALPLLLVLLSSPIIFGAAKPVPIDPFNFREPKKDTALTAAAGPVTNLLIALLFAIGFRILPLDIFAYGVQINVILAIFNLLPIPPLDGFKVVGGVLPDDLAAAWFSLERLGLTFVILILFFFNSIVNSIIFPLTRTILKILLP